MNRLLSLFLAALFALSFAPDAYAQRAPGNRPDVAAQRSGKSAATKATVQLTVVHATHNGNTIDPKLAALERQLEKFSYTNYEVLSQKQAQLSSNTAKKFSVEGGKEVHITLLGVEDNRARFRIVIKSGKGKLADTTVSIQQGRTFIVAGTRHDGGVLLLPITAKF